MCYTYSNGIGDNCNEYIIIVATLMYDHHHQINTTRVSKRYTNTVKAIVAKTAYVVKRSSGGVAVPPVWV